MSRAPTRNTARHQVTALLQAWGSGDETALQALTPLVEPHLRRVARTYMRGERAGQTGGDIRQHDRGPRLVGGRRAGQHEDAHPDDRADPEQRQVSSRQRALQRLGAVLRVADQLLDRLGLQEIRIHSLILEFDRLLPGRGQRAGGLALERGSAPANVVAARSDA